MHLLTLTSLIAIATAFQFPSWVPFVHSVDPQSVLNVPNSHHAGLGLGLAGDGMMKAQNRVAIVGAGAAGSSAAFWIGKAKERYGVDVLVDVYEKSGVVGGRECFLFLVFAKT